MKKIYSLVILALFIFEKAALAQTACSGAPASNTAVCTATNFCSGYTATLSLVNAYNNTGLVYQWAYSTSSALGPWTPISGANSETLATTSLTDAAYYTAVIGCLNTFQTTTATAVFLNIGAAGASTNVPYYENFESPVANGLPNCSWTASSLGVNCISFASSMPGAVPCSGQRMLGFSYSVSALGTHEFFTQGFNLSPSLVYSLAVSQTANYYANANNWSNFGMGIGTSQSAATSTVVYNTNNPIIGPCTLRSATFSIPTAGVYYLRIFATSVAGTTIAPYLTFDDLALTVPCDIPGNSATASIVSSASVICAGQTVSLNILPAPNCTVAGSISQTIAPQQSVIYTVAVTNTVSGCVSVNTLALNVNPAPNVFAIINPPLLCSGNSAFLSVLGGTGTYTLYPGGATYSASTSLSPSVNTTYTVLQSGINGCAASNTITLNVIPNATIVLSPATATVCAGEDFSVNASGCTSYYVGSNIYTGVIDFGVVTKDSTYQVRGFSANGCTTTTNFVLVADECTGISTLNANATFVLYPNPNHGLFKIQLAESSLVNIYELTGRLMFSATLQAGRSEIELNEWQPGMYLIDVKSDRGSTRKQFIIE